MLNARNARTCDRNEAALWGRENLQTSEKCRKMRTLKEHMDLFLTCQNNTIGQKTIFGLRPKRQKFFSGALRAPDFSIFSSEKRRKNNSSRCARNFRCTNLCSSGLKRDFRYRHLIFRARRKKINNPTGQKPCFLTGQKHVHL